jgi:hypothetical protein
MSTISGIGSGAANLYQFIQSLTGVSQTQPSTATSSTSSTSTDPAQALGQVLQGGHHHHHHGSGSLKQIQDAVTSALQTAQSTGSATDPNKIVEDAIAQILKNGTSSSSTSGTQLTDSDPDGAANPAATGSTGTSQNSNTQAFFSTLQSLGISPNQFQQDFLAAIKDAQGGQVNPATAFQSVPLGTAVDTLA